MYTTSDTGAVDLSVYGMTCASCVRHVEKTLLEVPGAAAASVTLASRRARVVGTAGLSALLAAVEGAGYRATPAPAGIAGEAAEERAEAAKRRSELLQFAAAAILTLPLVIHMAVELLGFDWMLAGWV